MRPRLSPAQSAKTAEPARSPELSQLVAAAKAGDEAALRDIIAWAMDYLFPAVLSMLYERQARGAYLSETLHGGGFDVVERLRDDAWAVTHLACCRLALRLETFRGRNAFGRKVQFATWVYAIAQNEMRTLLRDRWRERKRYGGSRDELVEPGPSRFDASSASPPTPESATLGHLQSALVRDALQNAPLTPEQREAVVLFHGYSYRQEQIAAMTGVQVGTVKKRIFDGLRKLQMYMEADGSTGMQKGRSG